MKLIRLIVGILCILFLSSFKEIKNYIVENYSFTPSPIARVEAKDLTESLGILKKPELKLVPLPFKQSERNEFLEKLGKQESGNSYTIINKYGYMGRYQFGLRTLRGLGYKGTKEAFLADSLLQEKMMIKLMVSNKKRLKKYIEEYDGKVVNGVKVTESGLLAAAHLGGATGVKRWFKKGIDSKDAFGTSITSYMERFGGYKLDLPS